MEESFVSPVLSYNPFFKKTSRCRKLSLFLMNLVLKIRMCDNENIIMKVQYGAGNT